ncbi:hypothetical protein QE152_g15789 [Popillia japonica]|uniref:Nuclease HARBI1 n=1 Tax=Popillia japonica TaxID=7064 RepID=A0AAW1L6N2_POPJA
MSLHNIADLVGMEEELTDDEDFIELLNIELRIPRVFRERINHFAIRAIAGLHSEFIEMPSNAEDVQRLRESFYNISKFPRCIGALDCTHIRIQSPGGQDAERYRNRNDFFSHNVRVVCDSDLLIRNIVHNVRVVCDSDLLIRNIVCRWHGSAHDSIVIYLLEILSVDGMVLHMIPLFLITLH